MTQISSDVIRGYNDTIILYLLKQGDSYGYEISKMIDRMTGGDYLIKETTLYSAFARLQKKDFIVPYHGEETNGRKRTYYKITDLGLQYYLEKCDEWKLTQEVINVFIEKGDT